MRRITTAERRARLMLRHRLAADAPARTVLEATRGVVALHATDPASVYLSARARVPAATRHDVERELYDERTVVRMLGMRRTLFVVPLELVAAIDAGCTRAIAARERKQFIRQLEQAGVADDGDAWLRAAEAATLAALEARGQATATELSGDVPALRVQVMVERGQGLWRAPGAVHARAVPARRRRPHRAHPAARLTDQHPARVAPDGPLVAGGHG